MRVTMEQGEHAHAGNEIGIEIQSINQLFYSIIQT